MVSTTHDGALRGRWLPRFRRISAGQTPWECRFSCLSGRARKAVEVLRQSEDPKLSLMGFVDAAVVRPIIEVEARYPELQ
jgi:hypothetical protein